MKKNLIFDFDGVLGDTWEVTAPAMVAIKMYPDLATAREGNLAYASKRPNHARGHSMTNEELARAYKKVSDFVHVMHQIGFPLFESFVSEINLIDEKRIAIVSSGSQNYVLPAMAATPLKPTHILAYENHHSKEEKIETICNDWGAEPEEVYYFTDTLADVYELRDMLKEEHLIGVAWGFCGSELLATELKPQYILKEPKDIHKLFN